MAERVRFELTLTFRPNRFSRPALSTAQPPLRSHGPVNVETATQRRKKILMEETSKVSMAGRLNKQCTFHVPRALGENKMSNRRSPARHLHGGPAGSSYHDVRSR